MKKYDLILTFSFLRIGGAENLIATTIQELVKKKVKFLFITLYIDDNIKKQLVGCEEYIVRPSANIENILKIKFLRYLFGPLVYFLLLSKYIHKSEKFLSFGFTPTYILSILKFFNKKFKIYYFECDIKIPGGVLIDFKDYYQKIVQYLLFHFQDFFDNILLKNVESIIVIDDKNLKYAKFHYKSIIKKFHLVYPPTNLSENFDLIKPPSSKIFELFKIKTRYLCIVGSLDSKKNTLEAVKLLYYIRNKKLNYQLLIIGGGELENYLKNKVLELNLKESVHFLGKISYNDLDNVYKESFCNLFFAVHQTWGLTPFEALRFGTPSIVSKEAGCAEFLQKKNINHIHNLEDSFDCCINFLEKDCKNFTYDKSKFKELDPKYFTSKLLSVIF